MSSVTVTQLLSDDEQRRFTALIYDRTGIRIPPQKKTLLSNRLRRLLRAHQFENFETYFQHLRRLPDGHGDWDGFLQEVTTHETYLFRDLNQWNWLRESYLPQLRTEVRAGRHDRSLRIWSAACSTGDEPYTIACCVADRLQGLGQWKIEIMGTDIGAGALEHARAGVFGERAMRNVPETYRRRFFTDQGRGSWQAKPELTQWMQFRQHNLMDPVPTTAFDLVFVKNVLIYFDPDSKRHVFAHVDRAIRRQGMLVSGPAEGIGELLSGYERVEPWLHRKP